jgi:hypothetical protein
MYAKTLITFIALFLISCNNTKETKIEKSLIERKKETKIPLFLNFYYGMSKEEFETEVTNLVREGVLNKSLSYLSGTCEPVEIVPLFINNKLKEVELITYKSNRNCFFELYKKKYGLIEFSTWKWKTTNIGKMLKGENDKLEIQYFEEKALVPEKEITYKSFENQKNVIDKVVGEVIINNNTVTIIQHKDYGNFVKSEILKNPLNWDINTINEKASVEFGSLESLSFTYKLKNDWQIEEKNFFKLYNGNRNKLLKLNNQKIKRGLHSTDEI